jgi:hypothetical protein
MRKIMRRPASSPFIVFFTVVLVLAGCFTMGCSTTQPPVPQPNETPKGTDFGFRPGPVSGEQQALSFGDVAADLTSSVLNADNSSAINASEGNRILYIRGNKLNENGDAKSWIFAVRHNNRTSMVTYDQKGRYIVAWAGDFPLGEIKMDSIINPSDLFLKNRAAIIRDPGNNLTVSQDLVLSMNNYTLTRSEGETKRVMVFDATTGALIRSNG